MVVIELFEIKTWKIFVTQMMPNVQLTSINHDYSNDCCLDSAADTSLTTLRITWRGGFSSHIHFADLGEELLEQARALLRVESRNLCFCI